MLNNLFKSLIINSKFPLKIRLFFSSYKIPFFKIKFAIFLLDKTELLRSIVCPAKFAFIFKLSKRGFFSSLPIFKFIRTLKFSFKKNSLDRIYFINIFLKINLFNLILSKDESMLKLKGSKNILPEKVILLFPIKELFDTKLTFLLFKS